MMVVAEFSLMYPDTAQLLPKEFCHSALPMSFHPDLTLIHCSLTGAHEAIQHFTLFVSQTGSGISNKDTHLRPVLTASLPAQTPGKNTGT